MKTVLLLLLFLPLSLSAQQTSTLDGVWKGHILIQNQPLGIQITLTTSDGEMDGSIDIPAQGAFNLPIDVNHFGPDSLNFEFQTGTGTAFFTSNLASLPADSIKGTFNQRDMAFPFELSRDTSNGEYPAMEDYEEEISIELESHRIAGTLTKGDNSSVVILVSGSGLQDRNSNIAGFEVFKKISESLYRNGYSSFRYDDQTIGGSTGNPDATIYDLSSELISIVEYFHSESYSFDDIIVIGHSQGGIVGTLASQNSAIDKLILMASPANTGDEIIKQQIKIISELQGIPEETVQQNLEFQEKIVETVRSGLGWEQIENELKERLNEQFSTLPAKQREALGNMDAFVQSQVNAQLRSAKTEWFRSFIMIDPIAELQNISIPILAIFGEKDIQVIPEHNLNILIESGYKGNLKTIVIPDANHLFQKANTGLPGEYGILDKRFADGFMNEIVSWLNSYRD